MKPFSSWIRQPAVLSALGGLILASTASAEVKLPAIFSDHMVLQQKARVPVWGWADPGEEVSVKIDDQTKSTKADAQGKWKVAFENLNVGGQHSFTVTGKNTVTVNDVLVGEVWLGSGQSNMALPVASANNYEQEKAAANFPEIRMFTVTSAAAKTAQEDCKGAWAVCTPETVGRFSAAAYFFGREIHQALKVPVGLIHSSVGGTPIESWIDAEAQHAVPELKDFFKTTEKVEASFNEAAALAKYEKEVAKWQEEVKQAKADKQPLPRKPQNPVELRARKGNTGGLFNGKIAPLIPYAIRGALWYQGEANSAPGKASYYQYQLPLLIKDWRARWGYDFPFAWVQLPNFAGPGRDWPIVREAMLKTLSVPHTGMAITIDIGEEKNIHPKNKQEVGRRLSLWALGTVYGQSGSTSGPLPAAHMVQGNSMVLMFSHADGGLKAKGGDLKGFEITGEDRQWKRAEARIDGDRVVISSAEVKNPVAARYAWENYTECNLYNGAGIPASPFRTDEGR